MQTVEKFGVVFVLWDGKNIQLEKRTEMGDKFQGLTIVPGGAVEGQETYRWAVDREVQEEYGVKVVKAEDIGKIREAEENGVVNYRHVFLVIGWEGELSNPEGRNKHIEATFQEARKLCKHPISQQVLNLVEEELLSQDS